jgi:hypothetical protein
MDRYEHFLHFEDEPLTEWTYNEKYHELDAVRNGRIVGSIDLSEIHNANDLLAKVSHFKDKSWWNAADFAKALKKSGILKK